jgi:ankyrin repeat protein
MNSRDVRLSSAVRSGDRQRVKELLEGGADPDSEGPFGEVLFLALLRNHGVIARLLIEAGADVTIVDDKGWTPLHWSAKNNDEELIGLIIAANGDLLSLDYEGNTPLDILAQYGHDQTLKAMRRDYPEEHERWAAKALRIAREQRTGVDDKP